MKSFLAGVLVATVVSAGVTYAVASGSLDTITACAHKKTGDLRLMTGKKCKKTERIVTWSGASTQALQGTQGASGPKGDSGSQGVAGPPGETGISQIYSTGWTGGEIAGFTGSWESMQYLELPPGQYLVQTQVETRFDQFNGVRRVACRFRENVADSIVQPILEGFTSLDQDVITLINHFDFPAGGSVEVECANVGGVRVSLAGLTYAIAADSIGSPPSICGSSHDTDPPMSMAC